MERGYGSKIFIYNCEAEVVITQMNKQIGPLATTIKFGMF